MFHLGDVFGSKLAAHLDELVRWQIVLAYLERLFYSNLGREPVAVPALGKMDVEPLHPFVACHEIDVAPIQRVPNVKVTARIRWWRVDTEGLARFVMRVEVVNVVLSPILAPDGFFSGRFVVLA